MTPLVALDWAERHATITAVLERARVAGGWSDEDVAAAVLVALGVHQDDKLAEDVPSKAEFPFKVVHRDGCGGVMFFLKRRPESHDPLISADAIYPDGRPVERQSPVSCQVCGKFVFDLKTEWIEER